MKAERNQTLDILKGFSIILVVLGHSIQFNQPNNFDENLIFKIIYSFHMPLFMFISGFVSYNTFDGSLSKLNKRFRSLVIPFLTWYVFSFIFSYFLCLFNGEATPNPIDSLILLIKTPEAGLWFLWILFLNYVILFFSLKISKTREEWIAAIFLLAINILSCISHFNYLGISLLKWYLFFYMLGYVINKHNGKIESILNILGIISLLIFPVILNLWSRIGNPTFYPYIENSKIASLIVISFKFLVPITGICAVYTLFNWIVRYKFLLKDTLLKLGTLSLELYSTHFYFFSLIFLVETIKLPYRILVTFFFTLIGSIIIQYLIKKNKILSKIFYGK